MNAYSDESGYIHIQSHNDDRKLAARNAAATAKRNGLLKEQPCLICGSSSTHMHHEDYDKPLDVTWLCHKHHSFWIERNDQFTIEVVAWSHNDCITKQEKWNWNVYAHIFDKHPQFGQPEFLMSRLAFNGGVTYDRLKTEAPALGIKHDWQKEVKAYTFGNDYAHSWDNENHSSPEDGIPFYVLADALSLIEQLKPDEEEQP